MKEIKVGQITMPRGDRFAPSAAGAPPAGVVSDTIDTTGLTRYDLDLAYANASVTQNLALFLPNTGDGPFPLVLFIHGGGFAFGDKFMGLDAILRPGLDRGFAVASINYRLSGEAKFPAAIEDTKAAIRYLRANAMTYHLDAARFCVWGESAGGNLAALAGTTNRMSVFNNPALGNPGVSSALSAVVDYCGPIDFLAMDPEFVINGLDGQVHDSADSFESQYLGVRISAAPWLVHETDPQTYIARGGCPPFWIEHGTLDENIPYQQSVLLSERLLAALPASQINLRLLDGAPHCGPQFQTEVHIERTYAFLESVVKPKRP